MSVKSVFLAVALVFSLSSLFGAEANAQAGLLTGGAEKLAPITLASGKPLTKGPYELESGKYYKLYIEADGSAELAIAGADFFRNVWVDEVVINDIEIRPLGVDSLEFDDEGTATISFGRFIYPRTTCTRWTSVTSRQSPDEQVTSPTAIPNSPMLFLSTCSGNARKVRPGKPRWSPPCGC